MPGFSLHRCSLSAEFLLIVMCFAGAGLLFGKVWLAYPCLAVRR